MKNFPAWLCALVAGLALPLAAQPPAPSPLRFTLRPESLVLSNCLAQPGAVPLVLVATNANLEIMDWAAAPTAQPQPGQFTLRFAQATPVGSVVVEGAASVEFELSGRWQEIPPGPEAGRQLQFLSLPAGVAVDGLRFTVPSVPLPAAGPASPRHQAVLRFATLVPIRLDNVARGADVRVSRPRPGRPPAELVDGRTERLAGGPAAALAADPVRSNDWVLLQWKDPAAFRGLAVFREGPLAAPESVLLEVFTGAGDPAAAVSTQDWKRVTGRATAPGWFRANEFFVSSQPLSTRALRFTGLLGPGPNLTEIAVLRDLGMEPVPAAGPAQAGVAKVLVVPRRVGVPVLDGRADDWPAGRTNGFALGWDEDGLRLLYEATGEAARFENAGTNLNELFFTGDALELLLQTRPGLDAGRVQPGRGDVRLVFSVLAGRPVVVLYEFRSEDLLVMPVAFRTGDRVVECDKVGEVKTAGMVIRRGPAGEAVPTLTVEAVVPWAALGVAPGSLLKTRGDFGRIWGTTARRLRWSDDTPLVPGDLAGAAAVQPARWGILSWAVP